MLQRQCFFDINQLLLIFSRFHSMRIQVESFVDWSFKAWFYDIDPISSAEVGWKSMPRCQVCSNEHRIFYSKQIPPRKISLAGFFRALDEHIFFSESCNLKSGLCCLIRGEAFWQRVECGIFHWAEVVAVEDHCATGAHRAEALNWLWRRKVLKEWIQKDRPYEMCR